MLIAESYVDIPTKAGDSTGHPMRLFVFHPCIPSHPKARFPGVVVFSEIYQVTGPVQRFARQIASHGYIAVAPSSYHEFTGPEPLAYDGPGMLALSAYASSMRTARADGGSQVRTLVTNGRLRRRWRATMRTQH